MSAFDPFRTSVRCDMQLGMRTSKLAKKFIVTIAAIAAGAIAAPAFAQPQLPAQLQHFSLADFDHFVQAFRKQHSIPAVSAVIVKGGAILWEKA
jgi:hypothetical protein